jgi:hypothetical protein
VARGPLLLSAYHKETDIDLKGRILASLLVYPDSDEVSELLTTTAQQDKSPLLRQNACRSIARWRLVSSRKDRAEEVLKAALSDKSPIVFAAALEGGRLSLYSRLQASMTCLASVSVANQCTSKHSARSVPLNDSTCALSVGFPGREKSICTWL